VIDDDELDADSPDPESETGDASKETVRRRASSALSFELPPAWWPVALAEQVTDKPRAFRLGARELAMYRDPHGVVHAVNDLCPHRRMPLSMGWVTEEGYLQCGYHGWCFDGTTGQCMVIPNLNDDERVSPSIRVSAFATAEQLARRLGFHPRASAPPSVDESAAEVTADKGLTLFDTLLADGFVHVWTGSAAPDAMPPPVSGESAGPGGGEAFHGEVKVRAPWAQVADALLWNPGRALGLGMLLGSGEELLDATVTVGDGVVVAERERLTIAIPRLGTFDPLSGRSTISQITTRADTGLTRITAESSDGGVSVRVVVGVSPHGEYRTTVRWRGELVGRAAGAAALAWTRASALGRRVAGRSGASVEATADDLEVTVDRAVDQLRLLRGDL
jgi:nitrite reductase/ring-hydroxylating ferredoxin subunit